MKVLIINGPNLNLLGKRQPEIYGDISFEDYLKKLRAEFPKLKINYFQSNHEGSIIDKLQEAENEEYLGIVINPAAYTHTSIAIADTILAMQTPIVEVHISDISKREGFRQLSYIADYVNERIMGKGLEGYKEAIQFLLDTKD